MSPSPKSSRHDRFFGKTTVQILIALGLIACVVLALHAGADTRPGAGTRDDRASVANRLATSRLAQDRADPTQIEIGTHTLDLPDHLRKRLPAAQAREVVRRIDGRIWEIEVKVEWREPGAHAPSNVLLETRVPASPR